jgi:hypothetical protein
VWATALALWWAAATGTVTPRPLAGRPSMAITDELSELAPQGVFVPQEARERLEEPLEIVRTVGASREEAQALNHLGSALAFLGDYPAGALRRGTQQLGVGVRA